MSQVFDIAEQFSKLAKDQDFLPVSLVLAGWPALRAEFYLSKTSFFIAR